MHSVKLGLVAAMLLGATALTTPAFATGNNQNHTCQGGNNCNGGGGTDVDVDNHNTAVGVGIGVGKGGNANATANNFNANIAKGGDADANANALNFNANVAKGGSATNTNNIDNKDFNANINANKNINKNDIDIDNKNINANINANKNTNNNTNKQHQSQGQFQAQGQSQSSYNDNSNSNNANLEVNTYNERPPVNTAYAAGLSVGEDTCMGSSSLGAQAVSFGVSIGTTWQDDNCRRLKNSRQLVALGYHRAATALMCVDEDVRAAMIEAGTPCPSAQTAAAVYVAPPPPRQYVPMAPIVDDRPVKRKKKVRKALPPK